MEQCVISSQSREVVICLENCEVDMLAGRAHGKCTKKSVGPDVQITLGEIAELIDGLNAGSKLSDAFNRVNQLQLEAVFDDGRTFAVSDLYCNENEEWFFKVL